MSMNIDRAKFGFCLMDIEFNKWYSRLMMSILKTYQVIVGCCSYLESSWDWLFKPHQQIEPRGASIMNIDRMDFMKPSLKVFRCLMLGKSEGYKRLFNYGDLAMDYGHEKDLRLLNDDWFICVDGYK